MDFSDFCKDQILLAEANVSAAETEWNEMNVLCINFKMEEKRETGAEAAVLISWKLAKCFWMKRSS